MNYVIDRDARLVRFFTGSGRSLGFLGVGNLARPSAAYACWMAWRVPGQMIGDVDAIVYDARADAINAGLIGRP